MLDKGTLVLECVTLAQVVELMVKMLVDLAGGTVLDEQTAEDTQTAHPLDLAVADVSANFSSLAPLHMFSINAGIYYARQNAKASHTSAYAHQPFPSSYQNPCAVQSSAPL